MEAAPTWSDLGDEAALAPFQGRPRREMTEVKEPAWCFRSSWRS